MSAPIGLASDDVTFSWRDGDLRRGAVQRAYRIVVTSVALTGPGTGGTTPVWDSGRVASSEQAFIPYAGPALASDAAYQWSVQTWAATGAASPLAPTATFETGLRDSDWTASWIQRATTDALETQYVQYTYARKEARLGASPIVRARAYVSADQQYELTINGQRAGKGEAYSFPDSQYYETLDVTHLLHAGGANAFALLYDWQGATKGHPAGTPGVIAEISVLHADGTVEKVVTDGTWRVEKGAWLAGPQRDLEGDQVDYVEDIDGRAEPIGWDQPGYDDSSWARAKVLGRAPVAPWTHLVSVRTRIVEQPVAPVTVTRLASGAVVADFGAVVAAVPSVTFAHGTAGHLVKMHAGYLLDPDGQVSTTRGTQHTDMSYSYIERGGSETFEPFDYLGFRYLQIDDPGEAMSASQIVALTRHVAVPDDHAAAFSSSDPTVDAVFELGRHSALFTAQEQFVDTPTREKGPWLWDGFNESQTAMAAFGDVNETRKSLVEFAQSQTRYWPAGGINKIYPTSLGAVQINEFTEIYPEWVWQYWMNTGDRTLLAAVYPALSKVADYVAHAIVPATGLVTSLPATSIYYAFPTVTRLNILGVDVFKRVADVAAVLGRPPAEIASRRAEQSALTDAINARLTRSDGMYVDGLDAHGAQVAQASQDTNAAAIVYGVAPAPSVAPVAAYIAGLGMQAPPRTAGEVLEALHLAGRDGDVVTRLTDKQTDGWAKILAEGATFTWEVWNPSDANGDSMSHGWGSNVSVEILRGVLGVWPTGPGYATFAVTPPVAGLASASGTIPTPRGAVAVAWHRPSGTTGWTLDLTVPANAVGTVTLPVANASALSEVSRGAHPVAGAKGIHVVRSGGGTVVLTVGAGSYQLRGRA
jgi:alpha-L-rhamnosidase